MSHRRVRGAVLVGQDLHILPRKRIRQRLGDGFLYRPPTRDLHRRSAVLALGGREDASDESRIPHRLDDAADFYDIDT